MHPDQSGATRSQRAWPQSTRGYQLRSDELASNLSMWEGTPGCTSQMSRKSRKVNDFVHLLSSSWKEILLLSLGVFYGNPPLNIKSCPVSWGRQICSFLSPTRLPE